MLNHWRLIVLQTSRHRMSLIWLCNQLLIIIWLNAINMDFKKGTLKSDSLASAVLPAVIVITLTPWKDPQCSLTRIITILHQDFRWKRLFPIFAAIKPWGSSIYFKKLCNPSLYCRVFAVTCRDKSTLVKCILFFCMLIAVIFVVFWIAIISL